MRRCPFWAYNGTRSARAAPACGRMRGMPGRCCGILWANAVANLRRDWYTVGKGGRLMKAITRELNLELGRPTADEALRRLTPKYRAAVHLFYYEGYTAEEIARMSGEKPSTIRTRLTRARAQLRELMKGELDDGFSQAVPRHE